MVGSGFVVVCCCVSALFFHFSGSVLALGSTRLCVEKERLLSDVSEPLVTPSECLLTCTLQTYLRMTQNRKMMTVRFYHTVASEVGKHCWPLQLNCLKGERLQRVFVVLPLDTSTVGSDESVGLKPSFPKLQDQVMPHRGQTTLSEDCGLRFDITEEFKASENSNIFCVDILPQHSRKLKCAPFLATTWLRQRQPRS